MDWHVAIASGGFTFYANHLKDSLRLIAVYANQLEIKDGKLTGKVKGPVVDAKYKAQALVKLAEFLNIPLEQTVAIGDGANDLKMLKSRSRHCLPRQTESVCTGKSGYPPCRPDGVMCTLSGGLKHEER